MDVVRKLEGGRENNVSIIRWISYGFLPILRH
jgi:hypothetical protein